jgi:hypothetical protein
VVEQQADPVVEAVLEGIALVVAPPTLNPDEEVAVAIWHKEPSLRSTGIDNCSPRHPLTRRRPDQLADFSLDPRVSRTPKGA